MDDPARRLRSAGSGLENLRGALGAGEPWPLSDTWGTEPEADWGPREVLGHVNEMLGYWVDQLEVVLAGDPATAVPFGRVASDPSRLARIATDRERSSGVLIDEIATGIERLASFADGLSEGDANRLGSHPSRGEVSVGDSIERFLVSHLEEHVVQLQEILRRPTA